MPKTSNPCDLPPPQAVDVEVFKHLDYELSVASERITAALAVCDHAIENPGLDLAMVITAILDDETDRLDRLRDDLRVIDTRATPELLEKRPFLMHRAGVDAMPGNRAGGADVARRLGRQPEV